jgi:putative transcription factor
MLCEMCSSPNVAYKIDVEGSRLNVCEKCASFGMIIAKVASSAPQKDKKKPSATVVAPAPKKTESVQIIKPDYSRIVRIAREKTGLTQEEFSKRINERESVLHKIESGHMKPDLELARKLEKALHVALVDTVELEQAAQSEKKKDSEGVTLGDLIRIK